MQDVAAVGEAGAANERSAEHHAAEYKEEEHGFMPGEKTVQ
jgi:hypothetical protein